MNKLPKIKIGVVTDEDLKKVKQRNILKCQDLFKSFPIATKVWICMKTGLSMTFVSNNWEEIIK